MKYQRWDLRRPGTPAARRSQEQAGLSPLCAALLSARGLDDPQKAAQFLSCGPERSHDPFLLKDMDRAVERIRAAIGGGERVCVYGDYDVDGITATCLLTEALAWQGGDVVAISPTAPRRATASTPGRWPDWPGRAWGSSSPWTAASPP